MSNSAGITFSLRPVTMGEWELATRVAHGDPTASIDLIVSRSEPKVTREQVCALTVNEGAEVMSDLSKSITDINGLGNLFGGPL